MDGAPFILLGRPHRSTEADPIDGALACPDHTEVNIDQMQRYRDRPLRMRTPLGLLLRPSAQHPACGTRQESTSFM
jgi:hypothetical protein